MARARNIKPSFFTNEQVADNEPLGRLFFIGLWTEADHLGNLEWKERTLKVKILPFDDCDVKKLAINLDKSGLIRFYSVQGKTYINIPNFERHQNPHKNEREKGTEIPDFEEQYRQVIDFEGITINHDKSGLKRNDSQSDRADSLFLIPSSPIPLPPTGSPSVAPPSAGRAAEKKAPEKKEKQQDDTELQKACKTTWEFYSHAYRCRYGVDPVRNAKVNSQIKQFCQALPLDEAPQVAEFYVFHNQAFYVRKGHDLGSMLSDAAKLRTEWATGKKVTNTQAAQMDRTDSMLEVAEQVKREMGYRQ